MTQMSIAVPTPTTWVEQEMIANIEDVAGRYQWNILRGDEHERSTWLRTHRVELALLSPLGYAQGVGKVDYRIIPAVVASATNFTGLAGVSFSQPTTTDRLFMSSRAL
jgi:hypothetical protein